jgi:hypothetical protein
MLKYLGQSFLDYTILSLFRQPFRDGFWRAISWEREGLSVAGELPNVFIRKIFGEERKEL